MENRGETTTHNAGQSIKLVSDSPGPREHVLVVILLLYRRARYGYPFRRIPLTQGKYALVDPDDYPRIMRYKWYASKYDHTFYAVRNSWLKFEKKKIQIEN